MPRNFLKCVAEGGNVTTKKLGDGKYIRLCKDKSGKWHQGEVKKSKKFKKTGG